MNISDIKINPMFESLLPALADEEFTGLEADIVKRRRIINPIIVWSKDSTIVDGHNRYKILIAHKMNTENIVSMDFDNESDVIEWIYNNQKNRRNLTKSQLVHVWSEWERQKAKEAKERQLASQNNNRGRAVSSNLNEQNEPIRTASEVAKKIGVSENTYRDMKLVTESGSQEKIDRMNKGGKGNGVSAIANEIRNGVPDGYRKCRKCGQVKIVADFKTSETICKECRNAEDRERERLKRENESVIKPKGKGAYSYAPREGYYDIDAPANWSFKDVKAEIECVFQKAIRDTKFIFQNHVNDVFSQVDSINKFADEIGKFASSVKFLEMEIRKNASEEENGTVSE